MHFWNDRCYFNREKCCPFVNLAQRVFLNKVLGCSHCPSDIVGESRWNDWWSLSDCEYQHLALNSHSGWLYSPDQRKRLNRWDMHSIREKLPVWLLVPEPSLLPRNANMLAGHFFHESLLSIKYICASISSWHGSEFLNIYLPTQEHRKRCTWFYINNEFTAFFNVLLPKLTSKKCMFWLSISQILLDKSKWLVLKYSLTLTSPLFLKCLPIVLFSQNLAFLKETNIS